MEGLLLGGCRKRIYRHHRWHRCGMRVLRVARRVHFSDEANNCAVVTTGKPATDARQQPQHYQSVLEREILHLGSAAHCEVQMHRVDTVAVCLCLLAVAARLHFLLFDPAGGTNCSLRCVDLGHELLMQTQRRGDAADDSVPPRSINELLKKSNDGGELRLLGTSRDATVAVTLQRLLDNIYSHSM